VESYLPGAEFTIAILGNGEEAHCLPIVGMRFNELPEGAPPIYGYEAKWIWDRPDDPLEIFECPARIPARLATQIRSVSLAAYHALECRDWCRVDVRCDAQGVPNVVELNPLPGILPDPADNSCFPKAARAAGMSYDDLDPQGGGHRVAADQRPVPPGGGRRVKIAILYDGAHETWDAKDVASVMDSVREIQTCLRARNYEVSTVPVRHQDFSWLTKARRVDVVFNLCEGIGGISRFEDFVVGTLELAGLPYTGCRPWPVRSLPPEARGEHRARAERSADSPLHPGARETGCPPT
jgi:D-alanine-D-alanine ligase-like ATP-grasp enzyme